jgi:inorganic triphosphatase YgiF
MAQLELEAKLAIISASPTVTADAIARLTQLDEFLLKHGQIKLIRDRYLDTSDLSLGSRYVVLRIRECGGQTLLTVKGPDKLTPHGLERLEFEAPWSGEALALSFEKLAQLGVDLKPFGTASKGDPLVVAEELGFHVTHNRRTERRSRDVVSASEPGSLLAELAIDATSYQVGSVSVRHHEIEVELRATTGRHVLSQITESLLAQWSQLRPWPYPKIATGQAIEALVSQHRLPTGGQDPMELGPTEYAMISERLGDPITGSPTT